MDKQPLLKDETDNESLLVVAAISYIMKYTVENHDFHKVKQTVNKRNPAQPGM